MLITSTKKILLLPKRHIELRPTEEIWSYDVTTPIRLIATTDTVQPHDGSLGSISVVSCTESLSKLLGYYFNYIYIHTYNYICIHIHIIIYIYVFFFSRQHICDSDQQIFWVAQAQTTRSFKQTIAYTLWWFNIAIKHGPFINYLPIKLDVKFPEAIHIRFLSTWGWVKTLYPFCSH